MYCSNRSHLSSSAFQSSCRNSVKLTQEAPATFRKESCLLPPITRSNGPSKRPSSTTTSRQQQVWWEPLPKKDYQVKPTSTLLAPGACCHRPFQSATVLQGRDITVGHLKHSKLLPLLWRCAPSEGTVTECMYGTQYGPLYMPNTTVAPQWTGVASQDHHGQMLRSSLVEFGDAKANEQTGRQRLPVAGLWRPQTHSVSTRQLLHSEASESLYDVKRISTGDERLSTQRGTHTDQVSNRSNTSSAIHTGATRLPGRGKTPHVQRLNPSAVNMSTFFEISEDLLQSYDCLKQISNAVMHYRALGFSRVGVRSSVPAYERLAQLLRIHKMVLRAKKEFGAAEMGGRPLLNTAGFSQKLSTTFLLNPPKENNRSLATPNLILPRMSATAPNLKQPTSQLKHHCIRGQPVLNAPPDDLELHGRKALIIQELQSLSDVMTGGEPDICLPVAVLMALVESADGECGECTAVPDLEGEGCTLQSEGVVKKQAYINTSSLLPDASKISTADSGETSKIQRHSHFKKSLSAPVIMRSSDRKPRHWCSDPALPEVESCSGSVSCVEEELEEEVWKEGGEDDEALEGSESLLLLQGGWSVSASRRSKHVHSTSSSSKYHRSSDGQALNATHKLESTAVLNDINDVINKLRGISVSLLKDRSLGFVVFV